MVQDSKKLFVVGFFAPRCLLINYYVTPLQLTCFAHLPYFTVFLVTGSPVFLCT